MHACRPIARGRRLGAGNGLETGKIFCTRAGANQRVSATAEHRAVRQNSESTVPRTLGPASFCARAEEDPRQATVPSEVAEYLVPPGA
jgi:hypothetical protein